MRIAVSACLLGEACRYDGKSVPCPHIIQLGELHTLVPVCPECLGGLDTPRPRAEIVSGAQGPSMHKVVATIEGADVTDAYMRGARESLRILRENECTCAILKSRSPSCGIHEVHDGQFGEGMVAGQGVTAALFREEGIPLFDETDCQDGLVACD